MSTQSVPMETSLLCPVCVCVCVGGRGRGSNGMIHVFRFLSVCSWLFTHMHTHNVETMYVITQQWPPIQLWAFILHETHFADSKRNSHLTLQNENNQTCDCQFRNEDNELICQTRERSTEWLEQIFSRNTRHVECINVLEEDQESLSSVF